MLLHLGLGDAIICNGLVRAWLSEHPFVQTLHIPCRLDNRESVGWMFRDLGHRVKLWDVPVHEPYPVIYNQIVPLWRKEQVTDVTCFEKNAHNFDFEKFDQEFYRIAKVDFEHKWASSKLVRDAKVELQPDAEVLIHDDPTRHFTISRKNYPELLKAKHLQDYRVRNIFQLARVLEGARELHVINSSVFNLMELLEPNPEQKRVWHFYSRPELTVPTLRKTWKKV